MASITLLSIPRSILHSNDAATVIDFLNIIVSKPDDRFPPFLQWAYVFSHDVEPIEMEALGNGVSVDEIRQGRLG